MLESVLGIPFFGCQIKPRVGTCGMWSKYPFPSQNLQVPVKAYNLI